MKPDELDAWSRKMYTRMPPWVRGGSLSLEGTRFLAETLLDSGVNDAVEIGTSSGFSAAVMAAAFAATRDERPLGAEFVVTTFDVAERYIRDTSRRTGDAAREIVPELVHHIVFHTHATAADLASEFAADSVGFLFIDANHQHPWPALDLLLALNVLRPGAAVVCDDINLPLLHPEHQAWGAHHLFYRIDVEKEASRLDGREDLPGMGRLYMGEDKKAIRAQLEELIISEKWECDVESDVLDQAQLRR